LDEKPITAASLKRGLLFDGVKEVCWGVVTEVIHVLAAADDSQSTTKARSLWGTVSKKCLNAWSTYQTAVREVYIGEEKGGGVSVIRRDALQIQILQDRTVGASTS